MNITSRLILKKTGVILILFCTVFSSKVDAQEYYKMEIINGDTVYSFAEQMPEFPGGYEEMKKYIMQEFNIPEEAIKIKIKGAIVVRFTVTKDGELKNYTPLGSKLGYGCDEEFLRVIKTMPKWTPGRIKNVPVIVIYNIPIYFKKGKIKYRF